ncbi:MAG: hypothetical protein J0L73_25795 [Verrucomicrobia bacterium]|nr:hypothetical protein [Verrucomicrobiota bacterium]
MIFPVLIFLCFVRVVFSIGYIPHCSFWDGAVIFISTLLYILIIPLFIWANLRPTEPRRSLVGMVAALLLFSVSEGLAGMVTEQGSSYGSILWQGGTIVTIFALSIFHRDEKFHLES